MSVRPESTISTYRARSLTSASVRMRAMDELRGESEQTDFVLPTAATGGVFQNLAHRAEAFITEHGGQASEDLLVSHVFGSAGSPSLWRPLLREVLGQNERLKFRADGAWLLADGLSQSGTGPLHEFVVLDVETTGLQPSQQRIIEIAVAKFSGGAATNLWESLCNPGRSVPKYIVKLTGIDDDLLEDAPMFDKIADRVCELLADSVIVGHNIEFDLAFLERGVGPGGAVTIGERPRRHPCPSHAPAPWSAQADAERSCAAARRLRAAEDTASGRRGCRADRDRCSGAAGTCAGCRLSDARRVEVDRPTCYATPAGAYGASELGGGPIDLGHHTPGTGCLPDARRE